MKFSPFQYATQPMPMIVVASMFMLASNIQAKQSPADQLNSYISKLQGQSSAITSTQWKKFYTMTNSLISTIEVASCITNDQTTALNNALTALQQGGNLTSKLPTAASTLVPSLPGQQYDVPPQTQVGLLIGNLEFITGTLDKPTCPA